MRFITCFFLMFLFTLEAYSQSGQYRRERQRTTTPSTDAPKAEEVKTDSSGRVDISQLEEQYWLPQDQEFKVVQNRKYSKEGRFALSAQLVPLSNDAYSKGASNFALTAGYHFSEFKGVEVTYNHFDLDRSELIDRFISQFGGTIPDHGIPKNYIGVNYNWVPIYGKMSVLDNRIIYFDLVISPGIGLLEYDQQTAPTASNPGQTKRALTYSLDFYQHFFFSENLALRLDMKNRRYQEERVTYNQGESLGKINRSNTLWQVGFTYYFGSGRTSTIEDLD